MSNHHCTGFLFKLCTECIYTIETQIQFTISLNCGAPDLSSSLFLSPKATATAVSGGVSAWKSPSCTAHSHPRKSRVTSMSCSLCTMLNWIRIESQITMHATTIYTVYAQEGRHTHDELVTIIPFNILASLFQPLISQL